MTAKLKGLLHALVNVAGNGAILELVPADYKPIALLVFNLAQIIYAFLDPTYAVHLIQGGKLEVPAQDHSDE
jgi:hypothetical protein